MRKSAMTALSAAVLLPLQGIGQEAQQDRQRGQMKSLQCIACHGPSGITQNPMFPHLAGQNASYLEIQLENFRTGERYHPLMTPVAQSLSRQDILDLAAYFSEVGPLAAAAQAGPGQRAGAEQ